MSGTFYLFRSTYYQTMRNLFYYDDQYQTQAQLTALTASEVLLSFLRRVSCRQEIPPRQITILCMILHVNLCTLLTSDFHSFPSHPHRAFGLLRLLMDGLSYLINKVCELRPEGRPQKNKTAETFTVESRRPSRVFVNCLIW